MKILNKFITAILSASMAFSAVSATAFADEQFGFSMAEIEASKTKPIITVDKRLITVAEASEKVAVNITVNITVNNAELKYSSTGLHVYYDSRLEIEKNKIGGLNIKSGNAVDYLATNRPSEDPTAEELGMKGVFLATSGDSNNGLDGIMWTINFILPPDVREGDVFPIDIVYRETSETNDIFSDVIYSEQGQLMSAYAFTRGIYNNTENYNFHAENSHIEKCPPLANIDRSYDGYIAIEYIPETTTTTTKTTTTTTSTVKTTSTTKSTSETTTTTTKMPATTTTTTSAPTKLIYGDANEDNEVNIADATAIIQHLGNRDKYGLTAQGEENADVDGVKGVTGSDALVIQQVEAHMISVDDLPLKN